MYLFYDIISHVVVLCLTACVIAGTISFILYCFNIWRQED